MRIEGKMEKLVSVDSPKFTENKEKDLRDVLNYMSRYGKVRLGQYGDDGTWHCSVELNIRLPGAAFEIKTGYGKDSPKCPLVCAIQAKGMLEESLASAREQLAKLGTD